MKRKEILLFFLLAVTACNEQSPKMGYEKLTYENMPVLQKPVFEKVDLPEEECMASYFSVYQDSILIINHTRTPNPYFLTVINLNGNKIIGRYLTKGNGPGEALSTIFHLYENRINIKDVTRKQLILFNVDSILLQGQSYQPEIIQMGELSFNFNSYDMLTDTSFLFYNMCYLENCGCGVNEAQPELLVSDGNGKIEYEVPEDAVNVGGWNGAFVISNINKGKVFLAYQKEPKFVLLDSQLNALRILYGPGEVGEKKYTIVQATNSLSSNRFCQYAGYTFSTENYIFIGTELIDVPREFAPKALSENILELYEFDWNGNLIARFQMPKGFSRVSYSETTNTLYITANDEDGELALYKAQL